MQEKKFKPPYLKKWNIILQLLSKKNFNVNASRIGEKKIRIQDRVILEKITIENSLNEF